MNEQKKRKTDRRTIYTKSAIKFAYLELLQKSPENKITVTEICKIAEINRCTFYLHYVDAPKVLEEIEDEVYDKYVKYIQVAYRDEINSSYMFLNFFKSLKNDPVYSVVLKRGSLKRVIERACDYAKTLIIEHCMETSQLTRREAELYAIFQINGCSAVCFEWLNCDDETIEKENFFVDQIMRLSSSILDTKHSNQLR